MKLRLILFAALAVTTYPSHVAAQAAPSQVESANNQFKAGQFAEAEKLYAEWVKQNPKDEAAVRQLGHIALLGNHLDAAEKWLKKAIELAPGDADAKVMLAQVFYRRDELARAGAVLGGIGPTYTNFIANYAMMIAPKLDSFRGLTAYELEGKGQSTVVKFVKSEPLPVVTVRVNGSAEKTFFIDTGGAELLLDQDFARELGVKSLGTYTGVFSGGQKQEFFNAKVDSLALGDWTLRNVPTVMMPLRQLSAGFGVKQLDGCIGTNVLYHFLATLDFAHGQLLLRRKTEENLKEFEKTAGSAISIPVWLAGDHFLIGMGQVNDQTPSMLFMDTGLAGAGIKLGGEMLKKAAIKLEEDKASTGQGGGGNLRIVPYTVAQVSFGGIKENNVPGLYDGPFPWEYSYGFYLAGMIGHDFVKPYAVTFDFAQMRVFMQK